MPHWLDDAVNRAIQSGAFDNLKGTGKPLDLGNANPYEDPSMRLANRVLKEAGYTLPWIADRNDILTEIETMRGQLQRGWQYAQRPGASSITVWQRTLDQVSTAIDELNQRIRDFNIAAPIESVHIPVLVMSREIERVKSSK